MEDATEKKPEKLLREIKVVFRIKLIYCHYAKNPRETDVAIFFEEVLSQVGLNLNQVATLPREDPFKQGVRDLLCEYIILCRTLPC